MSARRLALNAIVVAVLAFGVGHLLAVSQCQRDQLLAAREQARAAPGLTQSPSDRIPGGRRSVAAAGLVALVAAAYLGAANLAEGLALFLAGYAVLGLTMSTELVIVGYQRVLWPLLPLGPGEDAASVLVAFALLALLTGGAFYRAVLEEAKMGARPGRRPRGGRQSVRRRTPDGRPDLHLPRPVADTGAQLSKPTDREDDDARPED